MVLRNCEGEGIKLKSGVREEMASAALKEVKVLGEIAFVLDTLVSVNS